MSPITRWMRCITAGKSTVPRTPAKPSASPLVSSWASLAERSSALDGTQPVFRQSPPICCFSIRLTLAFTAAAM
ncbi:hypothetical protein D9M68_958150 [compost metagenome]